MENTKGMHIVVVLSHPGFRGTGTNKKVRDMSNDGTLRVPAYIRNELYYTSDSGLRKSRFILVSNPINPPGLSRRWDAGHILARQNGGSGTNPSNIFPQNIESNRWKSRGSRYVIASSKKKDSYRSWRDFEDKINRKLKKYKNNIIQMTTLYYPKN